MDLRPPLRWSPALPILGIYSTMARGFVVCFAAAVLWREGLVKRVLVWVFAAMVALNTVKAALSHAAREAAANWLWMQGNVVFLVSLLRFELTLSASSSSSAAASARSRRPRGSCSTSRTRAAFSSASRWGPTARASSSPSPRRWLAYQPRKKFQILLMD